MPGPDKEKLRDALLERLQARVELTQRSHGDAARAAEEMREMARDEGDGGHTSSFLAAGQAARYRGLKDEIDAVEAQLLGPCDRRAPIGLGALVDVENEDGEGRTFFVMKAGAGLELDVADMLVTVVTPASPIGRALIGKRVGEGFDLTVKGEPVAYEIVDVA